MRAKILTILLGLAVLAYAPLMAQVPEEPLPEEQPVTQEQPPAEIPPVEETEEPVAAETDELEMQTEEEGVEEELPATASPLPLIALLGGAGVASAAWLRLRRK
ncbi:MAG: LPXTG cell wall anchor domain-containing protein [Thermoanaerobaculia bacterium]